MSAAPFHLGPHRLLLDPAGALVWPAQHLLAVADLHLEKASHFAARGRLVPPLDSALTLGRLARLVRLYRPRLLLALGDSFHDEDGPARLAAADAAQLARIAGETGLTWIAGNHDPRLAGRAVPEITIEGITFRHAPQRGAAFEICGHLHPKARVEARGTAVTRACFLAAPHRILLPAFGAFTGGLDIRDPAIASCFPRGGRAFLLGEGRLFSFRFERGRAG